MWSAILSAVIWLLGLFGVGKPKDDVAVQHDQARQDGIDAAGRAAAEAETKELQDAQKARQDSGAVTASPDSVRERGRSDPNARPFDPDAIG